MLENLHKNLNFSSVLVNDAHDIFFIKENTHISRTANVKLLYVQVFKSIPKMVTIKMKTRDMMITLSFARFHSFACDLFTTHSFEKNEIQKIKSIDSVTFQLYFM